MNAKTINTSNENSETNLYAYERESKPFTKVTYRKNLVEEIQRDNSGKFDEFNVSNMNDKTFEKFVDRAEENGYKIYRMIKL